MNRTIFRSVRIQAVAVCFCGLITCFQSGQPLSASDPPANGNIPAGNASLFPIEHKGALTNPFEGLVIGNGDLAASTQVFHDELVLTLGKNDIWDSRIRYRTEESVLKHDDLIASNGHPDTISDNKMLTSTDWVRKSNPGPSPKPAGTIRIIHPGLSDTKLSSRIDISKGILTVEYGFWNGKLIVETFIHRQKNSLMMKLSAEGDIPWLSIIMEKMPDYALADMPPPEVRKNPSMVPQTISQTIPGKYGVDDFSWHLAAAFPGHGDGVRVWGVVKFPYALKEDIRIEDGESAYFTVGVATDRDGPAPSLSRAAGLAGQAGREHYENMRMSSIDAWNDFWSASAVEMEDEELEALWYRSMFGFACHLKPGAQAPGLNANIPIYDFTAWNGFYTWNHNVQKWYFPALPVNHPEWYDVFAELIRQHIPVFEYLADLLFGLEGVYCDLMTAPFAPPERAKTHDRFGRALAHTGWLSMMLFQHYQFTCDRDWLEKNAYPYIKKAAEFYANYLDKYQDESGDIYPSIRLEDSGWYPGFVGNRNVVTDLIMFPKAFRSAISASMILGVDRKERERWKDCLERIPEIEYGWKDGKGWYALCKDWEKVWPDFEDYLYHARYSRWGCGGWPVFPGEHLEGDEEGGLTAALRDLLSHVDMSGLPDRMRMLGTFHGEATVMPFIRMGMTEKYPEIRRLLLDHTFRSGQFSPYATGEEVYVRIAHTYSWRIVENQYMPILGIAEMLLQSQGNVIRFFPFWPEDQYASFRNLRARGGFMVSAHKQPGDGISASVTSLCGNPCRIRWTEKMLPVVTRDGKKIPCKTDGGDIVFETEADVTYDIR